MHLAGGGQKDMVLAFGGEGRGVKSSHSWSTSLLESPLLFVAPSLKYDAHCYSLIKEVKGKKKRKENSSFRNHGF